MCVLKPDPDLFDLAAWQARLAEVLAELADPSRDAEIAIVEAHITAIRACTPPKGSE